MQENRLVSIPRGLIAQALNSLPDASAFPDLETSIDLTVPHVGLVLGCADLRFRLFTNQ